MAAEGTDWVAVCDGDRLRGWVGADEIAAGGDARRRGAPPLRRRRPPRHDAEERPRRHRHVAHARGGRRRTRGRRRGRRQPSPAVATSACSPSTTWPRGSPGDRRRVGGRRAVRPVGLDRRPHRRDHRVAAAARPAHGGRGRHRLRDLPRAGARRRALAVDLRAPGRHRQRALRHPQPGAVRGAGGHPVLRPRVPHRARGPRQLHDPDPAAEHRRRPRRRARRPCARRPTAWATSGGAGCCGWTCRWPRRRSSRACASPP